MPEAIGIVGNDYVGTVEESGFSTQLENCYFPKLIKVGAQVFSGCNIKQLNVDNFPALKIIGSRGF